jgi:Chorismate synthase
VVGLEVVVWNKLRWLLCELGGETRLGLDLGQQQCDQHPSSKYTQSSKNTLTCFSASSSYKPTLSSPLSSSAPTTIVMSTFGSLFRVTTFGESHCASVGAIIDGCPPVRDLPYYPARFELMTLNTGPLLICRGHTSPTQS